MTPTNCSRVTSPDARSGQNHHPAIQWNNWCQHSKAISCNHRDGHQAEAWEEGSKLSMPGHCFQAAWEHHANRHHPRTKCDWLLWKRRPIWILFGEAKNPSEDLCRIYGATLGGMLGYSEGHRCFIIFFQDPGFVIPRAKYFLVTLHNHWSITMEFSSWHLLVKSI